MSSTTDENRDLGKQIGCMNSIFQIFDRHHFLTGRRLRGHHHKRLLQGATDPQYTTKAITEKALIEAQKEKPRISTESSLPSYSSSSCSSTFSSLDFNREKTNNPQIPFPLTPTKAPQSLNLVKDSMYREAQTLSIKPLSKEESQGTVMKHIDSPRPCFQQPRPKSPKPILPKGPTRVLGGVQEGVRNSSKYERLTLPRLSYDGRESRDRHKWEGKHKELPRLSLDSKRSSMKSRLDFPSHNKTTSIVTKLMGLENFPDTTCANQATYSPKDKTTSPPPRFHDATFVRKSNACPRFPIEPAPWKQQQDSSRGSPKVAKATTNNCNLSPSVFGEIEKRITELQIQKSGKDLRALKQILEAMQKTREQLEDRTRDSNFSTWKNNRSSHQFPTMEGPCTPKPLASSVISKPSKVVNKVRIPASNQQGLQNPPDVQSKDNSPKDFRKKVGNCTRPERSFGVVSPRLQQQQGLLRIGQPRPTTLSSNLGRAEKHCGRKAVEKGLKDRNQKVRAKDLQLSDDKLSEISSETRYSCHQNDTASEISESNNSQVSQTITEVASRNSGSTKRERLPGVEINVFMSEQPSPISVLDNTFYCEDSPSPVKKISTAFQDESPSPDEAEWHLKNLNHSTDFTRSNHAQKFENFQTPIQDPTLLTKPDKIAVDHNTLNHRYISKILLTSGLLKDSSFTSTADRLLSSCHLINPDMFHVLEQTEGLSGEVCGNNDRMQLQNKTQRKLIFDMVDEILVRKVTSGRLCTSVAKKTSPQGLLKEVYLEMDRVCSIPKECILDDEKDQLIRLLTDHSGEVPALVLDIERLIFKDLIKEVITVDYDIPCRKLFSK